MKFTAESLLERMGELGFGTGTLRDAAGVPAETLNIFIATGKIETEHAKAIQKVLWGTKIVKEAPEEIEDTGLTQSDLEISVPKIQAKVESGEWNAQEVLDLEQNGSHRVTLVAWLEEYMNP